jgi:hypothetical protein
MANGQELIRSITTMYNSLNAALNTYTKNIEVLYKLYLETNSGKFSNEAVATKQGQMNQIFNTLRQYNKGFGAVVAKFNRQIGPQIVKQLQTSPQKAGAVVQELIKLADFSDEIGAYELADELDKIAEEIIQPPSEGTLSTRYCPDHNGVQAVRISERVYQCPIDGKIYNYETGYTNYKGQKVPGGSIAAQTPTTSDFGGIPMRIYDSRQNILNRVN